MLIVSNGYFASCAPGVCPWCRRRWSKIVPGVRTQLNNELASVRGWRTMRQVVGLGLVLAWGEELWALAISMYSWTVHACGSVCACGCALVSWSCMSVERGGMSWLWALGKSMYSWTVHACGSVCVWVCACVCVGARLCVCVCGCGWVRVCGRRW